MKTDKYKDLFVKFLSANRQQLDSELERVLIKHGDNDTVKFEFFYQGYIQIRNQINSEIKDEGIRNKALRRFLRIMIDTLQSDNIENSVYIKELELYPEILQENKISGENLNTKYYNPNTKYGRKMLRKQAAFNYENGGQEHRNFIDNCNFWIFFIGLICLFIYLFIKFKYFAN